MRKYAKDKRPPLKPVVKAELAEGNKNLRIACVVIFIIVGVALISFSAVRFLGRDKGYTEIEAEGSVFSDFFVLNYDIGASGALASGEYRKVREVYTAALDKYSKLFSSDTAYEGVKNIHYINTHSGEAIVVDGALYSALLEIEESTEGLHYLGIVLEIYDAVFSCDGDAYASEVDPMKDAEMRGITLEACQFLNSGDAIKLEFLGNNTLKLSVSQEYVDFASKYGLSRYIDLGVFTNAFVVDAISEALIKENLTFGAISSYDGYSRNLDNRDKEYLFTFMAKKGDTVYPVCEATYSGSIATYTAKTYPTSELDVLDFYLYSTGESAHRFIDKSVGEYKSDMPELLLASKAEDCASLAVRAYKALVRDTFNQDAVSGVTAVWLDGFTVCHLGDALTLSAPYSNGEIAFNID